MRVRVAVVDDHPLFRRGICAGFSQAPDLLIVGEAETTAEAIIVADSSLADVIIVDADLGQESGIELTRQLRRRYPQTAIVVLTEFTDDEQLFQAIRAGAAAYASKQIAAEELAELIRKVASGSYVINDSVLSRPQVASRVLNQFRELSVLDESADGVFSPLLLARSKFSIASPRETATRRSHSASASPIRQSKTTLRPFFENWRSTIAPRR